MDVKVFDVYFLFCDCGTCECPWGSPGSQRVFCGLNPWVCLRSGCFWTASRSSKFYLHGESVQTDVAADCQSTSLRKTNTSQQMIFYFAKRWTIWMSWFENWSCQYKSFPMHFLSSLQQLRYYATVEARFRCQDTEALKRAAEQELAVFHNCLFCIKVPFISWNLLK